MIEIQQEHLFKSNKNTENTDISILKKYFPNCFDKNGNFLSEQFNSILKNSNITINKEYYSLNWLGKSYAKLLRDLPPETLMTEDNEHNSKVENQNSGNLLIQGDNLEVLKHLKNAYQEKVKMIYIDPPYNTGSDGFVYQDDRKFSKEQLSELAGIDLDEAQRILDFTDKKSNSHSAWLTFMYPRLYIARQLLKEDGVIFISIDDNEVAQLRLLCDEIFGEENFVTEFIWEKKKKPSFLHKNVGKLSEYILCYVKNYQKTFPFSIEKTTQGKKYPLNNAGNGLGELIFPAKSVKFNINDSIIKKQDMSEKTIKTILKTDLVIKNGVNQNEFILEGEWRYSQNKLNEIIKNKGELIISKIPFRPNHIKDGEEIKKMKNIFSSNHYEMETNEDATEQLINLFGVALFANPKPKKLIQIIAKSVSYNDRNAIILDFFSGSGTTADAVMQLNVEDGGNRQFILVQLEEKIESKGTEEDRKISKIAYDFVKNELGVENPTIFEITKERIIRSSKKILDENPEIKGDFGFKIYKTCENFCLKENELSLNQEMFPKIQFNDQEYHTLLTSWRLYDGEKLTEKVITIKFGDYIAYLCGKNLYLIYPHFESEQIKILIEMLDKNDDFSPNRIIFYGEHIESSKQKELQQALESYTNKKNLAINLLVRY